MKSYVITIMSMPESIEMAERCIASIPSSVDPAPYMFPAVTPGLNPTTIAKNENLNLSKFNKDSMKYSRYERCVSAFLSHYSLWKLCAEGKEDFLIFEHDAVVNGNIPAWIPHGGCISIGKPSYGKYNTPSKLGVNPLTSKKYFPGAHAYIVSPKGARKLVQHAKEHAAPTDVFLDIRDLPWLEEYYPWAAEAKDTFSTIQKEGGCLAKHGYKKGSYKLL